MFEYFCDVCDEIFILGTYREEVRCPGCLEWEAHPVDEEVFERVV